MAKTKTPAAATTPAAETTSTKKLTRSQLAAQKKAEAEAAAAEQTELKLDGQVTNGGNPHIADEPEPGADNPDEHSFTKDTPPAEVPAPIEVPAEETTSTPTEPKTDIMTTGKPMNAKQRREAAKAEKERKVAEALANLEANKNEAAAALTPEPTDEGDKAIEAARIISAQARNFESFCKLVDMGAVRCRQRNGQTVTGPVTQGQSEDGRPWFEVVVGRTKKDKEIRQSYWLHVLEQYLVIDSVKVLAGQQAPAPEQTATVTEPVSSETVA